MFSDGPTGYLTSAAFLVAYDCRVAKVPYIPISPVTLVCPQCGAKAGKACMIESGLELIHVERVRAPAAKDVAKKKLSENSPYAKDRERRLQKLLERLKKKT